MRWRPPAGVAVLAACACSVGCSSADPPDPAAAGTTTTTTTARRWVVTDLGSLGGRRDAYSYAADINDHGQIVGLSDTDDRAEQHDDNGDRGGHAFLWEQGRMRDLGTLGGPFSRANAINGHGQVVGCATTSAGESHAFLWARGRMRDLGTLGGPWSCAAAINDRGEIVGTSTLRRGGIARHAFVWSRGKMTDLGTFGGFGSGAGAINARGQIVASRYPRSGFAEGIVLTKGSVAALGGSRTAGWAINARGWVAGSAPATSGGGPDVEHAFLWSNGLSADLGTLGGKQSYAQGISDSGLVVGTSELGCSQRAFVWSNGEMAGLTGLATLRASGAAAVNNRGQVVGWAASADGLRCMPGPPHVHAVLWTRAR